MPEGTPGRGLASGEVEHPGLSHSRVSPSNSLICEPRLMVGGGHPEHRQRQPGRLLLPGTLLVAIGAGFFLALVLVDLRFPAFLQ